MEHKIVKLPNWVLPDDEVYLNELPVSPYPDPAQYTSAAEVNVSSVFNEWDPPR